MKDSYKKNVQLRCITCGDKEFEFNEDQSWIKCIRCGREYNGGKDELIELNQENISEELEETKEIILEDLKDDLIKNLKKSLKGNNNLKFQ